MSMQMLAVIARKSITNDEIVHIPAGYYHLVAGEFQLNNEHPPLIKMWAALPLLFIQPKEIHELKADSDSNFMEVTWSFHQRFWPDNKDQFERITFWARVMMILLSGALGVAIFYFARDLFSSRIAVLAVALYVLEPTVLAHGRIVHTDLPATLFYLVFFIALRKYLQARTLRRALLLGLAAGVALITKFSMIVLLPVLGALALFGILFVPRSQDGRKKTFIHAAIIAVVIWFVVNAAYRFESPALEPGDVRWVQIRTPEDSASWMKFFQIGSRIVPTYYLFGQYNVWLHNRDGHSTALLGHSSNMGWWYYFPVAFALKTSLPFLLLTIAGILWSLAQLIRNRDKRYLWLLAPMVIYALLAMTSHINIGVRHFLPEYSFFFVAAAVVLDSLLRSKRAHHVALAVVVVAFAWMTFEIVHAFPNYIPYMNELASRGPKWWYLSDSNVEWGDDAGELAQYLHAHGETEVRGAVSGAWGTLAQYGIAYHEIFPRPGTKIPETRYVAIGASFLNGSTSSVPPDENGKSLSDQERINYLAAYRDLKPEAVIGDAVYVFRVK